MFSRSLVYSYPVAYSIIVLPSSVVRWKALLHGDVSAVAQISTKALWNLSGAVDVALFVMTRRDVFLFRDDANPDGQAPAAPGQSAEQQNEGQSLVHQEQVPLEDLEGVGRLPDPAEGDWP
jgi:hypothetical protein